VRGLACLALLFDIYTVYQHLQVQGIRCELAERNELFELITENAADMIAVINCDGHRLYNSSAYQKILGYSLEELKSTSSLEQIHPEDRQRVFEAGEKARLTGRGAIVVGDLLTGGGGLLGSLDLGGWSHSFCGLHLRPAES